MSGWRTAAYRTVRPLLFAADPESVHHVALRLLGSSSGRWIAPLVSGVKDPAATPVEIMGLRFRNRIGLGAGFDKDGVAIRGWAALGFGFVELGTVTPRPQPGNAKPRLFRLAADEALVNRMGFNNLGANALARRIAAARPHLPPGFVIGVNIGRNRDGDASDYPAAARTVAGVADYLAINVSSPNTPGLRDLQEPEPLRSILTDVADAAPDLPLLVKLSPDLADDDREELLRTVVGSPATGVILSNTTIERPVLRSPASAEPGGLSGRPLLAGTLAAVTAAADQRLVVVGSGGVGSGTDARACLTAGADLVQLWTGMVYGGPGLIGDSVSAC
ncbi:MAG: quinone-dependent dihydroorotate dehydrogenase [Candidatus Limnocylindria bacterium]